MKNKKKTLVHNDAILADVISKGIFGITEAEHAKLKNVKKENLRDHLTPIELIFTALGEEMVRLLTETDNIITFEAKYLAAQKGGNIAGQALKRYENSNNVKILS